MRPRAALIAVVTAALAGCSTAGPRPVQAVLPDEFITAWSVPVETAYVAGGVTTSLFDITPAAMIVPMPDGDLGILETRSGRLERSIVPFSGWRFSGVTLVGQRLYTYLTQPDRSEIRFAAYDLATGNLAWQTALAVRLYMGIGLQLAMITNRGIVVQLGVGNVLEGLRLSDGAPAWQSRLPAACTGGDSAASGSAAVFLLECPGNGVRLVSVDPSTGRASWQYALAVSRSDVYPIDLHTMSHDDIAAEAGTTMRIFTAAGRVIGTRTAPLSCPGGSCLVGSSGSTGVLQLGNSTINGVTEAAAEGIDLATGRLLWQQRGELIGSGGNVATDADGTLFAPAGLGTGSTAPGFLPSFVLVMQASTGHSTVLPLPLAGNFGAFGIVGAADGLLITETAGPRNDYITAFRLARTALPGPAILDGVPAGAWPDACKLLTPADLRFIAPGYVFAAKGATLPGVTWRKPVTCAYVGPGPGDPAVTVSDAWVAASPQQAAELLASDLTVLGGITQPPPRIPGGYLVYDGAINGGVDQALVVAGRAIVKITVPGNPGDASRLAPIVAGRLVAYR